MSRSIRAMERAEIERVIAHPIEEVFARFTDHEGWSDWAGIGPVRLARRGEDQRDGKGALRRFPLAPGLREEVVLFDPPRRMDYRVTQGAPAFADHHAEVHFAEVPEGTQVTWRVAFRSRVPLLGRPVARGLALLYGRILGSLARDLDARKR